MAQYVISDIHGESDRFHAMLEKIQFSDSDLLYILGDVVDRGPDGITLLREIMNTSNMVMLLGNHEYMMLQYFSPDASDVDIRRWNRNGNAPTLAAYQQLTESEQQELTAFLQARPVHMEVMVNDRSFYLVHGFPGENVHDNVWNRPEINSPNPIPESCLIVGHTPISSLLKTTEHYQEYMKSLEERKEHIRIYHAPGFIDIDCGCGHSEPTKALACIRLDDMEEFYI